MSPSPLQPWDALSLVHLRKGGIERVHLFGVYLIKFYNPEVGRIHRGNLPSSRRFLPHVLVSRASAGSCFGACIRLSMRPCVRVQGARSAHGTLSGSHMERLPRCLFPDRECNYRPVHPFTPVPRAAGRGPPLFGASTSGQTSVEGATEASGVPHDVVAT